MKYFLFILFFSLASLSAYAELQIASIEIENGSRLSLDEIRQVLPIHEGDPYDPAKIDQTRSYLKKWGRFSDIDIRTQRSPQGMIVRIAVKEGLMISGLDIYGNYPYLSTRLRRILTVHTGELYETEKAQEQSKKLAAFYERRGYEGTQVNLTPRINEKKGTVDLVYRISRGKRYRIGTINVIGNHVFPYGYFVSKINPLLAYEPSRFRESLEKIRRDYQKKGYLNARVVLKDLGKDDEKKKVHPTIEITERKKVAVLFEGNHRVTRRTMKKVMPMFIEGGYSDYDIESSAEALRAHYRRLGFQEMTVRFEKKEIDPDKLLVRFQIDEGPQTRVKEIDIIGNREISDRKIKREMDTKENAITQRGYYQPRLIEMDFKRLPQILQEKGALEGEALDHETRLNRFRDKAHVRFHIKEGEITRIGRIQFVGNDHFPAKKLLKQLSLREDQPMSPGKVEYDRQELTYYYANHGFPYVQISHELVRSDPSAATLVYHIDEGSEVHVGEILIVGNERSSRKATEQGLLLKKGDIFSYRKILQSESELRRTGAYRNVKIETIGLTEKEAVVPLVVKVEEYRSIVLDFGATYDTDDSLTGNVAVTNINLLGTNRRSVFQLVGGRDVQRGELLLKDPHLLGYRIEGGLSGSLERTRRPGFKTVEAGTSLSLLREFTPRATLLGRYELTRTFFTDVIDATGQEEADHTISKLSFSFSYDKRNSFSDPRRGYIGFAGFDLSNKLIASTFDFIQPRGYIAHYLPLNNRMTLMNYFRIEGIKVFGGDVLTRDQRLFLGGDYSVRGFDQDQVGPVGADGRPAGGQVLLASTTELQTRLFGEFKFSLFLDNGTLTNSFSEANLSSLRHSGGFGLRYVTPVGPLRLDYGIKLDRRIGESFGRLHFAFGYAF